MIVKIHRIGKEIIQICKEKEMKQYDVEKLLQNIREYVLDELFENDYK